jgi:hypothetical protein
MLIQADVLRIAQACIPALLLLGCDVSATTVWTWVDDQGVKHYSQTPVPGATQVEIGPSNRASAHTSSRAAPMSSTRAEEVATVVRYTDFSVVQPLDGETLHNVAGNVPVKLQVDPALRPEHRIDIFLNDRRIDYVPQASTQFDLKDVWRGTHLLVAVLKDAQGKPLHEAAVTFNVRQASMIKPSPPKPVQPLP